MQAESIILDGTPKGPIHCFFYPVRYVQVFRPCSWTEFRSYICEGEAFREIRQERHQWLLENKIKCLMNYDIQIVDPECPHHYRLFTEFKCMSSAEAYIGRWCVGTPGGTQPQDATALVPGIGGARAPHQ